MDKIFQNPRMQAAALIVVILVIGWLIIKKPGQKAMAPADNNQSQETLSPKDAEANQNGKSPAGLEGTLKLSDDSRKGNLMLQTPERKIYIKTAKDFSALVGKEVIVTYDGTLESFKLGNIVAK